jgi:calcineurin-like phosphoesterase family protein
MKVYIASDWHLNHTNIATYCDRPANFTDLIMKRHNDIVKPEDLLINLGDVCIGKKGEVTELIKSMNGRKILIRGNHDRQWSCTRWMSAGFDFACDSMIFRNCWLTHEPADKLPTGTSLNLHGHLHNIWHGFHPDETWEHGYETANSRTALKNPWQRLFAIEYTDYRPVEFDKFVMHPDKYQARGPKKA